MITMQKNTRVKKNLRRFPALWEFQDWIFLFEKHFSKSRDNGKRRTSGSDEADETRFTLDETSAARCCIRRRQDSFSFERRKHASQRSGGGKPANPSEQTAIKFISRTFCAKPCLSPFVSEIAPQMWRSGVSNPQYWSNHCGWSFFFHSRNFNETCDVNAMRRALFNFYAPYLKISLKFCQNFLFPLANRQGCK